MTEQPFKIHTIEGYIQSLFLVEYPDKLLLLDSGCRSDVSMVHQFIEDNLGRSINDLVLVVVTHAHPDHSGGAHYYQQRFGIPIAGTHEMNDWYKGISGFFTQLVDIFLTHYVAYKKKKSIQNIWFPRVISFDHILQVDKSLPGFPDWTILSTPGHTAVDITIMNHENSIAYIGDCIIKTGQGLIHPYPINHPEKYKASLTKLRDLEIQTCLLAHHGSMNIKPITFNQLITSVPRRPKNHRNSILKMLGIST